MNFIHFLAIFGGLLGVGVIMGSIVINLLEYKNNKETTINTEQQKKPIERKTYLTQEEKQRREQEKREHNERVLRQYCIK